MVSPARYRRIVLAASALLVLIIFTGAAVRLTESGLGCEDWPTCSESQLAPEWSFHGWIEFGNRLLSGVVAIGTLATVIGARRRVPHRKDLLRWSWLLVIGVAAQVVLGGVTVLLDLHPLLVSNHFLLSIVLLYFAMMLWFASQDGASETQPDVSGSLARHSRGLPIFASVLLVTGTVVTGTGPNSGDFRADRFNLDLSWVARIHGATAWLFVAALVTYAVRRQRAGLPIDAITKVIALALAQGALGYWQYLTGVPPLLVMLHVIGSVAVWSATLYVHLTDVPPRALPDQTAAAASPTGGRAAVSGSESVHA